MSRFFFHDKIQEILFLLLPMNTFGSDAGAVSCLVRFLEEKFIVPSQNFEILLWS